MRYHRGAFGDHGRFLGRDRAEAGAEVLTVIEPDACQGDHRPMRVGGGGIEPPTEANL